MPALVVESSTRRPANQILRGLGHVVNDIAFEKLYQNAQMGIHRLGVMTPGLGIPVVHSAVILDERCARDSPDFPNMKRV
ncbi:MAG: hypothetical protein RLZZ437_684 [Pseudomonadota bacterium]|jgi:hypothetical protein